MSTASKRTAAEGPDHFKLLLERSPRIFLPDLHAAFAGRLGYISLLSGALVLWASFLENRPAKIVVPCWLLISALQFALLVLLRRCQSERSFRQVSVLIYLLNPLYLALVSLTSGAPGALLLLALLVTAVLGFGFPWSARQIAVLGVSLLLTVELVALRSPYPAVALLIGSAVLIFGIRNCAVSALYFAVRMATQHMLLWCERSSDAQLLIRLLGWHLARIADSSRVLLALGSGSAELITSDALHTAGADQIFVRGLLQRIADSETSQGLFSVQQLGEQFRPALEDWFGRTPAHLYYGTFEAILSDREEKVCVCLPISAYLRLSGTARLVPAVSSLVGVLRLVLSAQRSRFLSSGVLTATQISATQQEEELNQVIHQVNNAAQDISILCDDLKQKIGAPDNGALEALGRLEGVARNLSSEVSDVKLLRELDSLKRDDRFEAAPLGAALDELHSYGIYRAFRRGHRFVIAPGDTAQTAVKIISREYLETMLRFLVREASKRLGASQSISVQLEAPVDSQEIQIAIADDGPLPAPQVLAAVRGERVPGGINDLELDAYGAVRELCRASGGGLRFERLETPASNRFVITLQRSAKPAEVGRVLPNQWILLVDDNVEVTTFYSRVAGALDLGCASAESLSAAQQILDSRGRPRLVITDLQLGQDSGFDVVRLIRARFGDEIPVIVVSGNLDDKTVAAMRALKVARCLTKPVGRRKLFAEISEILAR
ncbi:MAG: response regulator [Oligoflexia bacterium]|nr:response regulator [Oligoflexia bacterium]